MPSVSPSIRSAVLAVLQEAKGLGVSRISKTSLVKLVYLLDCLYAEEHQGQTASKAHWYFHHYGPFAVDLVTGVETLGSQGVIQSLAAENRDKDFTLFWLGEYPSGPSLEDVGLSSASAGRFRHLAKKFANDLPRLLDHVYFKTVPMADAIPGRALSFEELATVGKPASHRHAHIRDNAKILRLLQLQEALKQKHVGAKLSARAIAAHRPIYDGEFERAMVASDLETAIPDEPVPFNASLH